MGWRQLLQRALALGALSAPLTRGMRRWAPAAALLLAAAGALLYARAHGGAVREVSPAPAATTPAATPSPQVDPGYVSVNSTPWSVVYLDGDSIGPTPVQDLRVPPGRHRLRLVREGYESVAQELEIASGTRQTIANVTLKRVR